VKISYESTATESVIAATDYTGLIANQIHDRADTFRTLLCELNEAKAFEWHGAEATNVALELTQTATQEGDTHYDLEIALYRHDAGGQTYSSVLRAGEYDDLAPLTGCGEQLVLETLEALIDMANAALYDLAQVLS
jgi:hypothetical protein